MNIVLIIYLILFIVQIVLGVFVYTDSKNRGMNAILWTCIVILAPNLFGLIFYLAYRMQQPKLFKVIDRLDNVNSTFKRKHNLCQTCGREINEFDEKCIYCNSPTMNDFIDTGYNQGIIKRKRIISTIAIFTVIIMISFSIIAITPFRYISSDEAFEIFKGDFLKTNKRTETTNSLSSNYTYWDGKDEKIIEIQNDGILSIDYEMESKEGILYSVIKNEENIIIMTIPGNIHETYVMQVNKDENLKIIVIGQNTKGFYKFEWQLD